jgi:hypothetical protein
MASLVLLIALGGLIAAGSYNANRHPRILVGNLTNQEFLTSMEEVDWKRQLIADKKEHLHRYMDLCLEDPQWLLSRLQMNWETKHHEVYLVGGKFSHSGGAAPVPTVRYSGSRDWATDYRTPELEEVKPYLDDPRGLYLQNKESQHWEWVAPARTGHIIESINEDVMRLVADAAFFYWLTGEVKYAEFATPIFFQYMEGMHYRNPPTQVDDSPQAGLSGLATFEVIHESIVISLALTYDFLFDYFKSNDKDLTHSQAVFQKWGDQIIKNGVPNNNWNLFQARFLTYIALVLEDDQYYENGKGQQYFLKNTFENSSERQIALRESMLVFDQHNGIWPESSSYSMHVITTLLEILTLLDHSTNANELANYPIIEKAARSSFQYLFPSGYTVGFGDSNHRIVPPKNLELLVAHYRKYEQKQQELEMTGFLEQMIEQDLYRREARGLFELFFYVDHLSETESVDPAKSLITPTFYAPNVSLFIQRLGQDENAMMVSTVGSFGNHAHSNGMAMELFANNYVLGPDMGRGISYWNPDHREYYSQFPAHNTVVVDGISGYPAMRSYHPYQLDNCFPKSGVTPLFDQATYSMTSFLEPKTRSNQQRFTAQVKTNHGPGYILDVFRSKKIKDTLQTHDYFYHNLGQSLQILDAADQKVILGATDDLGAKHGDQKAYDYFEHKKKAISDEDIKALFTLEQQGKSNNLMKLWIKGHEAQQIYTAMGPPSRALSKGTAPETVLEAPIPTLILRRQQQAWNDPFVVVYNPHRDALENPIQQVAFNSDGAGTQDITVALSEGGKDRFLVGSAAGTVVESNEVFQNGLLSLVRTADDGTVDFIFVSGMNIFQGYGWQIISEGTPAGVTIERKGTQFWIQNDQPVLLRIPKTKEYRPGKMTAYAKDGNSEIRWGKSSRFDKDQIEYRLAQPHDRVVIEQMD